MFENVREDIRAWEFPKGHNPVKKFFYLLFRQELHAVLIYRFGHWAALHCRVPVLKSVCLLLYFFLNKYSEIVAGIYIWPVTEIGPGLKVEHFGGVMIGGRSFGRNLRVSSQVIIGHIGGGRGGGIPVLGDDVQVGAGAKILGEVKIGSGAKIGANAVVLGDVPEGAIAVGVPAVIKWPKGAGPTGN